MAVSEVRRALLSLAVGGFAIGTGEFVVLGLLPNVAGDLSVSIPEAGHLVSAYALGVVVGAPVLTAASVRMSRKVLLVGLMLAIALANVLSALAPTYETLLAARFVAGLPHGAFFGVGAVLAAGMVEPSRRAAAMSVMFTGLTVANIVGVPITTLIGQHASWRLVFGVVGLTAALAAAAMMCFIRPPKLEKAPSLRGELRVFKQGQVWLALGVATFGGGSLFATFSYIAPMMTHVTGYAESSVTGLLVLFGIGMTVGNIVGAKLADWSITKSLYIGLIAEIVVALVFLITAHSKVGAAVTILIFPMVSLIMLPSLQIRIIGLAGGAPNLAAASIQAAFNIANSLGAWLGGAVIAAGLGYNAPNAVAAGLAVIGLLLAVISTSALRLRPPVVVPNSAAGDDAIHMLPAGNT